jgi:dipeptidyl aminopeptidase/acylaminoacyl peptidase
VWSTRHPGNDTVTMVHRLVEWTSRDDVLLQGQLLLPVGTGPFPLYVDVHGGPVDVARATWLTRTRLLALLVAHGVAVFRPNPRGSMGRGEAFKDLVVGDLGGWDVDDVLCGVDAVVETYPIDTAQLAIGGASYGGYLTYVICTRDRRFAAAVAVAPVSDYLAAHYTCNIPEYLDTFLADSRDDPTGRYRSRSPIHDVAKVRTPMLTVVGMQDQCSPPSQGHMFHRGLVLRTQTPSRLVSYPLEGHGIRRPAASVDVHERVLDWLTRHGLEIPT